MKDTAAEAEGFAGGRSVSILHILDEKLELYLGIAFLLSYAAVMIYDITARVTTGNALTWSSTVVKGLFIWMSWLATAYAVRENAHIRFSYFLQQASNRLTYIVYWAEWISWLVVGGIIFRYSIDIVTQYRTSGSTVIGTNLPRYLLFLSITVGFAMILIRVVQKMYVVSTQYRSGEDITIEPGIGGE